MATTTASTYDLTQDICEVCRVLADKLPALSHVAMDQVIVGISQSRARGKHGIYAACNPLRFEDGNLHKHEHGQQWEWPVIRIGGHEILYYVHFYVPRFLNLKPLEKLETIVHELYHISPEFNGDLRRLGRGRHAFHGPSLAHYRKLIEPLVNEARELIEFAAFPFLERNHRKLSKAFGRIVGTRVRKIAPRLASK